MALTEEFLISHQQRQILSTASDKNNLPYFSAVIGLDGRIEQEQLHEIFHTLINRHEIFRTRFVQEPGMREPVQRISDEPIKIRWSTTDQQLAPLSNPSRLNFDTLIEATVFISNSRPQRLYLNIASLICDQYSIAQICHELCEYGAECSNVEESVQYVDFSQWQDDVVLEDIPAKKFWESRATENLPFPSFNCDSTIRYNQLQASEQFSLAENSTEEPELGRLLTLWVAVLARFSGSEQITVLTHFDGRASDDFILGMGPYARMVPLVAELSADISCGDLQRQIVRSLGQLDSNQMSIPLLSDISSEICVGFEYIKNDVFPSNTNDKASLLSCTLLNDDCDLKLNCQYLGGKWQFRILFDSARFNPLFVDTLRKSLLALQSNWQMDESLSSLSLISNQLDTASLNQNVEFDLKKTAVELFQQAVLANPDNIAVVSGEQKLTYLQLDRRANQLSNYLIENHITTGKVVGICLEKGLELSIAMLAVLKSGGTFVAIDPNTPMQRSAKILENADLLLTNKHSDDYVAMKTWEGTKYVIDEEGTDLKHLSDNNLNLTISCDSPAYVLFTSGSTGKPKGVVISHSALSNYLQHSAETYLSSNSGAVVHTSIGFDLTITGLLAPLIVGKKVVMVPDSGGVDSLQETLLAQTEKVMLKVTPSHLKFLNGWLTHSSQKNLPLDTLIIGGEALFQSDIHTLQKELPSLKVFNEYGPTEATVGCCLYQCPPEATSSQIVPIGYPISGTQLYVLDSHMQLLPQYCKGELFIGGVGLAEGYLNQQKYTEQRFIHHVFADGSTKRLYSTGDLVSLRENGFVYHGRDDNQVKIRGHRVEVGEVEAVLKSVLQSKNVLVKAQPNKFAEIELIAYIESSEELSLEAVHQSLSDLLPDYMLPSNVICLEEFPLTQNGKVDAYAMPEVAEHKRSHVEYVAPRNEVEQRFVDLFQVILKQEKVGIKDNFFVLGGDSIRAVQLIYSINEFGYSLSVEDLFNKPNIEALAELSSQKAALIGGDDTIAVDELLNELDGLSDDEVARRLAEFDTENEK